MTDDGSSVYVHSLYCDDEIFHKQAESF